MLGSDAEQVLRMAPMPVLLIRSAESGAGVAAATTPAAETVAGLSAVAG
jgi:hypothetical protein